jgi:hypothetical protein
MRVSTKRQYGIANFLPGAAVAAARAKACRSDAVRHFMQAPQAHGRYTAMPIPQILQPKMFIG